MLRANDSQHKFYFMPEITVLTEMFGRKSKWLSVASKS